MHPTTNPEAVIQDNSADDIRAMGWRVAVHNDYTVGGFGYTFWLFTHYRNGRFVKGEGRNDAVALNAVRRQIRELTARANGD